MAEPTLQDVFGSNATQTSTTITITKADLTGLTASSSNTAESIFVAILLKAKANLTQTNFDSNIDQSIYIATGFSSFTNRGTDQTPYRTDQLTVTLAKIDEQSDFDPDDY
jgi:hypothetical protein